MSINKKQKNISFIENSDKKREEECIKFLEDRGFIIILPVIDKVMVRTLDDLLTFFYSTMYKYSPERKLRYTPMSEDRKSIRTFVNYRHGLSRLSKSVALFECSRIIEVMFRYESKFNLSRPITSPLILMQDWLVNRVISIINSEDADTEQEFFSEIDDLIDASID